MIYIYFGIAGFAMWSLFVIAGSLRDIAGSIHRIAEAHDRLTQSFENSEKRRMSNLGW